MKPLLLEIGAEEIPAGYIEPALAALEATLLKQLSQARIDHGASKTYGTPRRLAVSVMDVAEKQAQVEIETLGPPEKVAFDDAGAPTMAAVKFAEKMGLSVDALGVKETPKGRYLNAVTTDGGKPTATLLAGMLAEIIRAIPFPKTMKWGEGQILFARPIQSLLALFGTEPIHFTLGDIQSGAWSWGHSIMRREKLPVASPEDYTETLRAGLVIADISERKAAISAAIETAAASVGGRVLPDAALLDIVTNLVEFPVPVVGKFDADYLELPSEVLITAMREHQKYFAIVDGAGNLLPHFIAINNTRIQDAALAAKGHERVLRARLEDARFFYRSDRAASSDAWVNQLKKVLFQARLGSVHDKVVRIGALTGYLADEIQADPEVKRQALRAAQLCKADLVSQVVGEFPKLQGVMGRVYAALSGEPAAVAAAIEEHYQPSYSGGALPASLPGALVALADKMDSICGCFSVGLIPTGTADPYALRRQAIGILQILLDRKLPFSLPAFIETATKPFSEVAKEPPSAIVRKVSDFFISRMTGLLVEAGFSRDAVSAVTAVSVDRVPDVWDRVRVLEKLKADPDFEPLAIAFKRVVNIIKKAETDISGRVDEALFEAPSEGDLYRAYQEVARQVEESLTGGRFDAALRQIASLRSAVDAFFDGVLVMAEDAAVRANRLALLGRISELFALFADFSKLST
jgi:glycyl-tRNA synthetase beta chain